MPDESGETRRERNARFNEAEDDPDPIVTPDPDMPSSVEHVWGWFWELSGHRHSGPEPLTWADIGAWRELTRTQVLPEEVSMLMAMDRAYVGAMRKEHQEQQKRAAEKRGTK